MKKVVLACGLCAFSLAAFGCDSAEKQGKEALEGFYAGAGLCYMHTINKGALLTDNDMEESVYNLELQKVKADKIGGSLVAGYGLFATGNFYVGGELLLDIAGNKTVNSTYTLRGEVAPCRTKTCGFVPSLALRFGGYCSSIDTLFFGRVGLANVRSEFGECSPVLNWENGRKVKVSKLAPVFGIGVEKRIACVNLRLEGDYRFQADKEREMRENAIRYSGIVRDRTKGYTVRVMAVYNF